MFEQFTEKAKRAMALAQEEARIVGHNFVGTEQILLGLISEGGGVAARALRSMGVNLRDTRVEVLKITGRGSGFVAVEPPLTPRAKRVLELAWEAARELKHQSVGTGHLLLGLLREKEGIACRVLVGFGISSEKLSERVIELAQSEPIEGFDSATRVEPSPGLFENLTKQAIKVIMLAQEEARRLGHNYVGTEQILLGLIGEGSGLAARTLRSSGVDLKNARIEVEKLIGRGAGFVSVQVPFTVEGLEVMNLAKQCRLELNLLSVDTEHLLFGIIQEGSGVACKVLLACGVEPEKLKFHLISAMKLHPRTGAAVQVPLRGQTSDIQVAIDVLNNVSFSLAKLTDALPQLDPKQFPGNEMSVREELVDLEKQLCKLQAALEETPSRLRSVIEQLRIDIMKMIQKEE